ncbi:HDOD domain-containing protein [Aliikangiella coralliicola]|uniref:HDOD domain-containing protein n=1 Tax=Aliikangiella coralliicola TaxID=2592383 RepID=A0A545UC25_9GAMM|nr:HDOD domain-containing protein [Aliikangiella coralliicola]
MLSNSRSHSNEKDVLGGIYIPPQPGLIDQIEKCGADLESIGEVISADPGVSAAVIKIVNSPAFGLAQKIGSIPQAVVMLGVDRVISILKTLLLRKSMANIDSRIDMNLFWRSSVSVASVASTICRQLNLSMADEAYTLGLFHNCGIPVLAARYSNYQEVMEFSYSREDGRIASEEFANFGVHHAAAGYRISRVWNLPKVIALAVKNHHSTDRVLDDQSIENPTLKTLLCVLKMAEHMVNLPEKLAQSDIDFEWQKIGAKVLEFVGLSEYDYEDLEDAVRYTLGKF